MARNVGMLFYIEFFNFISPNETRPLFRLDHLSDILSESHEKGFLKIWNEGTLSDINLDLLFWIDMYFYYNL